MVLSAIQTLIGTTVPLSEKTLNRNKNKKLQVVMKIMRVLIGFLVCLKIHITLSHNTL